MLPVIQSRQNARVRELRAALSARKSTGSIGIEGTHLLEEALAASQHGGTVRVSTVFLREDRQELLQRLPHGCEAVLLSREVFESAAATEHSQGVAALMDYVPFAYEPAGGDLVLVAAGVQDPGNLGTLIRSAEAFGAAAVVLTSGTVDPWNGKALRASAGSTFRMPLVPWSERLAGKMRAADISLLGAVPAGDKAIAAERANLTGGCALVIGNEGNGVPQAFLALCDSFVTLPMSGKTESLNAAVAGSILLYEAARQRR